MNRSPTVIELAEHLLNACELRNRGEPLHAAGLDIIVDAVLSDRDSDYWNAQSKSHAEICAIVADLKMLSLEAQGVVDGAPDDASFVQP